MARKAEILSIVFVDQVHHNLYHDILFLCSVFGYHERKGDEGAVGDAFDAVTKEMVLGDEIEQHGGLILYTGVEVHTAKGLIDLPNGALEGVVLLVAKERGVAELLFQHIDFLHSVLVGGVKGLLAGGLA